MWREGGTYSAGVGFCLLAAIILEQIVVNVKLAIISNNAKCIFGQCSLSVGCCSHSVKSSSKEMAKEIKRSVNSGAPLRIVAKTVQMMVEGKQGSQVRLFCRTSEGVDTLIYLACYCMNTPTVSSTICVDISASERWSLPAPFPPLLLLYTWSLSFSDFWWVTNEKESEGGGQMKRWLRQKFCLSFFS